MNPADCLAALPVVFQETFSGGLQTPKGLSKTHAKAHFKGLVQSICHFEKMQSDTREIKTKLCSQEVKGKVIAMEFKYSTSQWLKKKKNKQNKLKGNF